ncbi:hypothetical protein K8354_14275 [Polaribacter litorisediminis]|uniref:hypothetical protein n=1 Tax=Polaribacter litorisediminis TaxID=1908341 RepID=UPI001CBBD9E2|nr:hypothetical protein [Polaribacter litorisediminis]UAM97463.1 hypothetical protein K8354_14275 [Polaribacter litorisediminis]
MKYLLFVIVLMLSLHNTAAQELPKKSEIFVRVYNNVGEKIAKGKILSITENSLILKKGSSSVTIPSNEISYLKTKRSNGHNVLLGASGGSILGLAIVASESGNSNAGFGGTAKGLAYAGAIVVVFIGSGVGYLTTLFKNSNQYIINGDTAKWQGFKEEMYAPKY